MFVYTLQCPLENRGLFINFIFNTTVPDKIWTYSKLKEISNKIMLCSSYVKKNKKLKKNPNQFFEQLKIILKTLKSFKLTATTN